MKKFINSKKQGFTLLEILVVISIIGVIVAMAAVSYSAAQKKGRDTKRKGDMEAIQDAYEEYYSVGGTGGITGIYPNIQSGGTITFVDNSTFLVPSDPGTGNYSFSFTTTTYCICAAMETGTGGNSADASCSYSTTGSYYCVSQQQ